MVLKSASSTEFSPPSPESVGIGLGLSCPVMCEFVVRGQNRIMTEVRGFCGPLSISHHRGTPKIRQADSGFPDQQEDRRGGRGHPVQAHAQQDRGLRHPLDEAYRRTIMELFITTIIGLDEAYRCTIIGLNHGTSFTTTSHLNP